MIVANLSLTAAGYSVSYAPPMKTQVYQGEGGYSLLCYITGTLTATVQVSNDPLANPNNTTTVQSTARWISHDVLVNMTASRNSSIVFPIYAVRLYCSSYSSGGVYLDIGALDYLL